MIISWADSNIFIDAGHKGRILALFYSNTSSFATSLAKSVEKMNFADLSAIAAKNPPIIPEPKPICGRSRFCTKASHCRGAFGCICVAERWYGEFFYSSCKWPVQTWRGLSEIDSANVTQSAFLINSTLTAETSTALACPCNCTYVSKACCNSPRGIVYEAPDLRLGALQPPLVNLTCNATTGEFQASSMTLDVMLTTRELGGN